MNGRFYQTRMVRPVRLAVWAFAALCVAFILSGCQEANMAANQVFEQSSLTDNVDHLSPWTAPEKGKGTVVQFLPFSGVPVNTADAIYKVIRARAANENINLALRLDEPATYRVRTLINAVGSADVSIFIFIVELYDVSGKRVHRFVGQEYGAAPGSEPWSGIDAETERHIGDRILYGIKDWVTRAN